MNADQPMPAKVLSLLRQWGWETGLEKLEADISATADAAGRTTLQRLLALLLAESAVPEETFREFHGPEQHNLLDSWARAGQALAALRAADFKRAHEFLDR